LSGALVQVDISKNILTPSSNQKRSKYTNPVVLDREPPHFTSNGILSEFPPHYRRTAICRGAIFKGFLEVPIGVDAPIYSSISVVSTVARQSLGIMFRTPFEVGKHLECDKVWDETREIWLADEQMSWYLEKVSSSHSPPTSSRLPINDTSRRKPWTR
jgi:hypothetical protein